MAVNPSSSIAFVQSDAGDAACGARRPAPAAATGTHRFGGRRSEGCLGCRPVVRSRSVLLVTMCTGYFLVLLDVTVVNVALPRLGDDLGADTGTLQWVVD